MDGNTDLNETDGDLVNSESESIEEHEATQDEDAVPSSAKSVWSKWFGVALSVVTLAFCCGYIFWVVHPELIFLNTTPTGGDMGAHVWGPAYLRDHLLTQGRLTGWSQDWYAGFPAYGFYMVIPSLIIVLLDVGVVGTQGFWGAVGVGAVLSLALGGLVANRFIDGSKLRKYSVNGLIVFGAVIALDIPYNIAFKMTAVVGAVFLPAGVWYLMRGLTLRRPGPELAALASVFFLMDKTLYSIYGGNLASTLAGEFAFSISLTLSLFALGSAARGLKTRSGMARTAALLGLAALCHVIPAFFAMVGAFVMFILRIDKKHFWKDLKWSILAGSTALFLAAWWYIPFFGRRAYLNDMGWEKLGVKPPQHSIGEMDLWKHQILRYLFPFAPHNFPSLDAGAPDLTFDEPNMLFGKVIFVLAGIGIFLSIIYLVRAGLWLTIIAGIAAIAFIFMPQDRFWNARVLPFYYLAIYLLAAVGVALVIRTIVLLFAGRWIDVPLWVAIPTVTAAIAVTFVSQGLALRQLPGGSNFVNPDGSVQSYQWGFFNMEYNGVVRGWADWNFNGLERKGSGENGYYQKSNEYFGMIDTMADIGEDRGCGRAMWEFNSDINEYGTTMAPMLLPYFTDGCIGSMEGLYFEASSTTPFHFLVQSELSESPSAPERFLNLGFEERPYQGFNMSEGIDHLQMMGVRYYMAKTESAKSAAREEPRLTMVGTSSPWEMYEVADAPLIEPLANLPVDWTDVEDDIYSWAVPAVEWFNDPEAWSVYRTSEGPEDSEFAWPEAAAGETPEPVPAPHPDTAISNIVMNEDSLSFDVDKTGSPILVKMSYFPNWNVSGAEGPFRVAPNFMVVVPTSNHIEFTYSTSTMEYVSYLITLLGIVLLVVFAKYRPFERDDDDVAFEFFGDREPSLIASEKIRDEDVSEFRDGEGDSGPAGEGDQDEEPGDTVVGPPR